MTDRVHQLSFLAQKTQDTTSRAVDGHVWWLYVDGASKRNPGLASAGIYIVKDGIPHYQDGCFLGTKTNNQAEYIALLFGLFTLQNWYAKEDRLQIFSDSLLVVQQLNGVYKVKHDHIRPLHTLAYRLLHNMKATITHIPREQNEHADRMANEAFDEKKPASTPFVTFLHAHEITI
jgi:ribonuclease HI